MPETVSPEIVVGFRELLHELRIVGSALVEVVERIARLETKVDRVVVDQALSSGMQTRIAELEHWFRCETATRAARGTARGLWLGVFATIAGGVVGAAVAHLWR